jgi:hypothetical protein
MNHYKLKTNITSDTIKDEIRSAFKSDRRIWSLSWIGDAEGYIIEVDTETDSSELIAKINSLGFKATVVQ